MEREAEESLLGPVNTSAYHWSENRRRRTGAFYTPYHLIEFLVQRSLGPILGAMQVQAKQAVISQSYEQLRSVIHQALALQVVDPACGCGRFLLVALRSLQTFHVWLAVQGMRAQSGRVDWREARQLGAQRAVTNLVGCDLDAQALQQARRVLQHAAGIGCGTAAARLIKADVAAPDVSLRDHIGGPVMVIIGNPPWGAASMSSGSATAVGLSAANANTFGVILMRCLEALAPGGRIGVVLPRNFCKGTDYTMLRRQLLAGHALEWVADVGQAFAGVTQEAVAIVARRLAAGEKPGTVRVVRGLGSGRSEQHVLQQSALQQTPEALIALTVDHETLDLLRRMERITGTTLRDWVEWGRGLEYGGDGALMQCGECGAYTSLPKKKQASKPCPLCGNKLAFRGADYHLIRADRDARHSIPVYAGRHVRRYRLAPNLWLDPMVPGVSYRAAEFFLGPKLLIRKISASLMVAVDETDAWTTQGVYVVRPQPDCGWTCYALASLLNSAPMSYYYEHRFNDGARLTTNVTLNNLLALPVPGVAGRADLWRVLEKGGRALSRQDKASVDREDPTTEAEVDQAVCTLFRLSSRDAVRIAKARRALSGRRSS